MSHPRTNPPHARPPRASPPLAVLDPIELQVIAGALRAACEEMGAVLIGSARSSNIKERHDASTALFDRHGEMVMQAEHIPVHLGSMPAAVQAILGEDHSRGSSWVLNDPFAGGTHLPDITVITPVFAPEQTAAPMLGAGTRNTSIGSHAGSGDSHDNDKGRDNNDALSRAGAERAIIGYAASRAHHADVGGRIPGSMPADSRTLEEEGVVISPTRLDEATLRGLVASMRQPVEREADLRAQLAANRIGARRLSELAIRIGGKRLSDAFAAVLDYAQQRTSACLRELGEGVREAWDVLEAPDGDLALHLTATVRDGRMRLDFSGSADQHAGNLNCPLAVTRSACLFAVRVLTDPDIPPSAGAYRPIEIVAPDGSILNARPVPGNDGIRLHRPAVAAGNVETSSRVADLVLSAFGRAQGQGTMNNLTLGAEGFSYYETLGGGQGACPDADGPSGVHVAMSNTLNTPVEALEREFPLRVTTYALRHGSGGAGRHRGGDGVVRELEALSEMSYSLIAERRTHAPRGAAGGTSGKVGHDLIDGHPIASKSSGTLHAGERLRIETPGGGGYGDDGT